MALRPATPGAAEVRVLTRDQLLRVRDIDNQVYGLLTKADSGLTEAQRVAKALNLVDELNRMAGK